MYGFKNSLGSDSKGIPPTHDRGVAFAARRRGIYEQAEEIECLSFGRYKVGDFKRMLWITLIFLLSSFAYITSEFQIHFPGHNHNGQCYSQSHGGKDRH